MGGTRDTDGVEGAVCQYGSNQKGWYGGYTFSKRNDIIFGMNYCVHFPLIKMMIIHIRISGHWKGLLGLVYYIVSVLLWSLASLHSGAKLCAAVCHYFF